MEELYASRVPHTFFYFAIVGLRCRRRWRPIRVCQVEGFIDSNIGAGYLVLKRPWVGSRHNRRTGAVIVRRRGELRTLSFVGASIVLVHLEAVAVCGWAGQSEGQVSDAEAFRVHARAWPTCKDDSDRLSGRAIIARLMVSSLALGNGQPLPVFDALPRGHMDKVPECQIGDTKMSPPGVRVDSYH